MDTSTTNWSVVRDDELKQLREEAALWREWADKILKLPSYNFSPQTTYWDLRVAAVIWKDHQHDPK